jgi:hypothetical protein
MYGKIPLIKMGVQTSESCDLSIILLVMQKPTATFLFLFSCLFVFLLEKFLQEVGHQFITKNHF